MEVFQNDSIELKICYFYQVLCILEYYGEIEMLVKPLTSCLLILQTLVETPLQYFPKKIAQLCHNPIL